MGVAQSVENDFLKTVPLFSGLPEKDMGEFIRRSYPKNYKKGEYIYHQGDAADRFFIIVNGWVRLYREMIDGDESISSMMTKGDIFGEGIIFYQSNNYIFSAQAVENTRVFEISKATLQYRADNNPDIFKRVMSSLCEKMIKLQAENERLANMTTTQRVACLLLRLSSHMVGNGGIFTFPYDKSLAALQLGMKRETFSRALVHLKPLGVSVNGSEIKIDHFQRLAEFSCKQCSLTPEQCAGARYGTCRTNDFSKWLSTGNHNSHGA